MANTSHERHQVQRVYKTHRKKKVSPTSAKVLAHLPPACQREWSRRVCGQDARRDMPIIEEMPPDEPPAGLVTGVPDPDESYHDKMQKQIDRE